MAKIWKNNRRKARCWPGKHGLRICENWGRKTHELIALLEKNKQTIDEFGEVNLLALNEYEELDKRYTFLSAQIADLNTSLNVLQRTITRINKISAQYLPKPLPQSMPVLRSIHSDFPGRPRWASADRWKWFTGNRRGYWYSSSGKRTQNVNLLSGGENRWWRLLLFLPFCCTVLLHFWFRRSWCALDDANTNLFNRLVKDVAKKSQVIMITHNKSTMEVAETLFGVTMQKQGYRRWFLSIWTNASLYFWAKIVINTNSLLWLILLAASSTSSTYVKYASSPPSCRRVILWKRNGIISHCKRKVFLWKRIVFLKIKDRVGQNAWCSDDGFEWSCF